MELLSVNPSEMELISLSKMQKFELKFKRMNGEFVNEFKYLCIIIEL